MKRLIFALCALLALALGACGKHSHSFENWSVKAAPTCTESGAEKGLCACGAECERDIPPTGHSLGVRIVTQAPDCEGAGQYETPCKNCGEILDEGELAPIGHKMKKAEAKAPTCAEEGCEAYEYCEICGFSDRVVIEKLAHRPTKAPDCDTPQTCKDCGEILREALGHLEVKVAGKQATCAKKGLSDGVICALCDEILLEQIELPKIAHTEEIRVGKAATCISAGRTDESFCTECGTVIVAGAELPRRPHSYSGALDGACDECGSRRAVGDGACIHENQVILAKIPPTCESYGLTQGVVCKDCGEVLVAQEAITPTPHRIKTQIGTPATPTQPGLSDGKYCLTCRLILTPQLATTESGK